MPTIVGLSGSPSAQSRTRTVIEAAIARIAAQSRAEARLVDIAGLVPDLGVGSRDAASARLEQALRTIEAADLLIVGSPVYKGSYSGLLKHLVDLVEYPALAGVPVGLIATGGSERHALVVEHHLRPLFAFFCAATLPTAVFLPTHAIIGERIQDVALQGRFDQLIAEAVAVIGYRTAAAAAHADQRGLGVRNLTPYSSC